MKKKPTITILIVLIMFPQFVETIYSPALPSIVEQFDVSNKEASQTISIYFIAFALGVVFWGILSDKIGRRKSMLSGLIIYTIGSILAILASNFNIILIARIISAFGAAVGSVVTQTILRDIYDKKELGKVFSIVGITLSISPVIGLITGGIAAEKYGHIGVFSILLLLAFILSLMSFKFLPETKNDSAKKLNFKTTLIKLLNDKSIWLNTFLVSAFNIMLFSYYSLAPFIFEKLGCNSTQFGYSGIILAISSFIGSMINKKLIHNNISADRLILIATIIASLGSLGVLLLQHSLYFLIPMMLIIVAYGLAIPNILSQALIKYRDVAGTAGALFGLMYYVLIGIGLAISGLVQNFGLILITLSLLSILFAIKNKNLNHLNK